MRAAQARGNRVLALTNNADSQAAREADAVLLTHAGTEIGVAATKTFTAQVAALAALGLRLAAARGSLGADRRRALARRARRAAGPDRARDRRSRRVGRARRAARSRTRRW